MTDPRGPERRDSEFMPIWGWAALAIAVIVVFGLIFTWGGDGTRQQAETPTSPPPATSPAPPAKSPTTPPASPTTPPAQKQ